MTERRVPGCTGKRRFATRKSALRSRKLTKDISGRRQHVYRCTGADGCGNWHLTSSSESRETFRQAGMIRAELARQREGSRERKARDGTDG